MECGKFIRANESKRKEKIILKFSINSNFYNIDC
jgi:hypothetical protein